MVGGDADAGLAQGQLEGQSRVEIGLDLSQEFVDLIGCPSFSHGVGPLAVASCTTPITPGPGFGGQPTVAEGISIEPSRLWRIRERWTVTSPKVVLKVK